MKKYIWFLMLVFLLQPLIPLQAQNIKHVQKTPSFFVPQQILSQANKAEKVPSGQQILQNAKLRAQEKNAVSEISGSTGTLPQNNYASASYNRTSGITKMRTKPAPVDEILQKQPITPTAKKQYKDSILTSYYLTPGELKKILQAETASINADTKRMIVLKNSWQNKSPAFKFVNFRLNEQISTEITLTNKNYKNRKAKFDVLLQKTPADKRIPIIEATNPLFWHKTVNENHRNLLSYRVRQAQTSQDLHYVSVFTPDYRHAFTYHRKHINPNRNRRLPAAKSGNPKIDNIYQAMFDGYISDLGRISAGLDITNQVLLRQISEMQNQTVSESY